MFWKSVDGTGQRDEFPPGEYPRFPSSFTPDGKTLAFVEVDPSTKSDIWLTPVDGDRKAQPLLNTDAAEFAPKFSPDGHWLAYVSDETGREEVYIRPIGSPGGRRRISTGGGRYPTWNRNGRELFFVKGDKLASIALDVQMNRIGQEQIIWDAPKFENLQFQASSPYYDVMPDGEHFVVLLAPQYPSPTHYNVVVNWLEELKQRVPVK